MTWKQIQGEFDRHGPRTLTKMMAQSRLSVTKATVLLKVAITAYKRGYLVECLQFISALKRGKMHLPSSISTQLDYLCGDILLDLKEYSQAVGCFDQIISNRASDIAFANKALALWELGRFESALVEYLHALKLNPSNAIAQRGAGEMYLKLDKPKLAIPRFKKAISIKSDYSSAFTGLGVALYRTGEWGKSYLALQRALALDPSDWIAKKGLTTLEKI